MSFNPNDNNLSSISRNNYEEYFLLYADNELNAEERLALEQFLLAHPDLQPELDLLLSTKLPLELMSMENKESLLAHAMKLNTVDEALLLYIDNELTQTEKKRVEARLKIDKAYQLQYNALLQTKPGTPDKIVYPFKKELYRFEETKRFSLYWVRVAAAVIIFLGMGIFVFTYQQKPIVDSAKIEQDKKPVPLEPANTDVAIDAGNPNEVEPTVIKIGQTDDVPNVVRHIKKKSQIPIKKKIITNPDKSIDQVAANNGAIQTNNKNIATAEKQKNTPQQIINTPAVTPNSVASFNDHTTSPVTAELRDVVKTGNEKKSSLKGFLRKATRFIERRTNISTTNENNELLIGAVALKL